MVFSFSKGGRSPPPLDPPPICLPLPQSKRQENASSSEGRRDGRILPTLEIADIALVMDRNLEACDLRPVGSLQAAALHWSSHSPVSRFESTRL